MDRTENILWTDPPMSTIQEDRRMVFVGVSTGASSINAIFPRWMDYLGISATLIGRDIALGARPEVYRSVVTDIADDPSIQGALVTSHKATLYDHAGDSFDVIEPTAVQLEEISVIYKQYGKLCGGATDPLALASVLGHIVESQHWQRFTDASVLILGAGGAGLALAYVLCRDSLPHRVILTDISSDRILKAKRLLSAFPLCDPRIVREGDRDNDKIIMNLPAGSLVVNATGLGKDRPGSPVSRRVTFPERAIVWEFNYRGNLQFLEIARDQAPSRQLVVSDGWSYFVRGWATVIGRVFGIDITDAVVNELGRIAAKP